MGHMGTASLIILPLEEPPTITCVRLSLSNSTTATLRLPRINTAPQLRGHMDSHRRGPMARTAILLNPKGHSIAKAPRLTGREDTGVAGRPRPRVDILELDTALVGNTRLDRMGSLRPAKADGAAIRRGIKPHRRIGVLKCWLVVYCCE